MNGAAWNIQGLKRKEDGMVKSLRTGQRQASVQGMPICNKLVFLVLLATILQPVHNQFVSLLLAWM